MDEAYKSKLNEGQIPFTIKDAEGNEETYWLKPTMRAMQAVNRNFQGMGAARNALAAENFDAALFVIRQGLNLQEKDIKTWTERIWVNGVSGDLLVQLLKFTAVLSNGGRPLPEELEDPGDEPDKKPDETSSGNFSPSMSG